MNPIETVLALLFVMAILLGVAKKLRIAYPILLVVGGLCIGGVAWLADIPTIELEPDLVFLVFLPPIIQSAAFWTPIRDFKRNASSIGLLAIGAVLFTTCVIGVISHYLVGLPWAVAFILGAIVAPPDASATTSFTSSLRVPHSLIAVLEGESLVNDATALTALGLALTILETNIFSPVEAMFRFVLTAVGGLAVGYLIGWGIVHTLRFFDDVLIVLLVSFLVGYAAYIIADRVLHVSGVLADVALGLTLGRSWRRDGLRVLASEIRLPIELIWESVIALLNSIIFILIGLQLPRVLAAVLVRHTALTLLGYAIAVSFAVIAARLVWVFACSYIRSGVLGFRHKQDATSMPRSYPIVIGWAGMRGVVSLAAALALPLITPNGIAIVDRNIIIFLTFCVILTTLIVQGLSLPTIIRQLRLPPDMTEEQEQMKAHVVATRAGQERLHALADTEALPTELLADLNLHYSSKLNRFQRKCLALQQDEAASEDSQGISDDYIRIQYLLQQAEYEAVVDLRDKGVVSDAVLHHVQRELDFERIRLMNANS